ncbi:hypothetical protein CBF23_004795 [Marinomonas agarivorans]|nr:hypothetical protein CBF23_004795 [Marinomonas agarivorans]
MTQLILWLAVITSALTGLVHYRYHNESKAQIISAITLTIHAYALALLFLDKDGFDFLTIGMLIALIGNAMLWLSNRTKDISLLLCVSFPLAAILILLNLLEPWSLVQLHSDSVGTSAHILIAAVAYSLFTAACGIGILLFLQEYQLKHHKLKQLLRVPPLQVLEQLMFEFIWSAFLLLTLTIITGVYFLDDMFAQKMAHKTFFTIISWFVFASLLAGRKWAGWRGQIAVKLTLFGFAMLMLGYFGTRIILQFVF